MLPSGARQSSAPPLIRARGQAVQLALPFEGRKRRARIGGGQLLLPLAVARRNPQPGFDGLKRLLRLLKAQARKPPG